MATQRVNRNEEPRSRRRKALTPEARENQLIALAVDTAERMMQGDNPPAQVVTHYLKMGSERERLERKILAENAELLKARREALESARRVEELYTDAMNAFRAYSGQPAPVELEDE